VTFSYPTRPEEVAIRHTSLFFPAGETTFVIGRSGSGKSTLGQLLVRFYQPSSGKIFLDGVALDDFDVHWLRRTITLVEQHSVLFNKTIRDNIALGKHGDSFSHQEIMEAVRFAMLDPIVHELPDGLDTELGPSGSSLSGGQIQRMALARAKIRDTPVLILDESTSALDYITRAAILQAIRNWRKGKTTVVITHDISQIQADDFLYLMENAQVVQEGYREELEARSGAFHVLAAAQEEKEYDYSDDDFSDYDYETDEIISLYDDTSWNLHSPMHRPMSAVLFGENLLSPFLRKGRESFVGSVMPRPEKKLSRRGSEEDTPQSGFAPSWTAVGAMKLPPGMSSTVPGSTQSQRPASRPIPMVSQNKRLSGVISYNRALPISKEFGPRWKSIAPSPPGSRKNSYPRRLSTGTARNVRSQQSHRHPRCQTIADRLHLLHSGDAEEKHASSTNSLSIAEIFKSVWPTLPWQSRIVVFVAFFCAIVHAAATPVFAWIFAQLLTTFYTPGDQSHRSLVYSLIILGLAFGDGIATYLLFFLADAVAQSWVHALKVEAMRRILLQPCEFFDREENSMSRLAETLDHFAEEARNLPGRFAVLFVVIIFMIAISIVWALVSKTLNYVHFVFVAFQVLGLKGSLSPKVL
jgi:ATP-binding cassette subfamily B (MDR/TAP) protein 1